MSTSKRIATGIKKYAAIIASIENLEHIKATKKYGDLLKNVIKKHKSFESEFLFSVYQLDLELNKIHKHLISKDI